MNHLVIEIRKEREVQNDNCDDCPERIKIGEVTLDLSGSHKELFEEVLSASMDGIIGISEALGSEDMENLEDILSTNDTSEENATISDFSSSNVDVREVDVDEDMGSDVSKNFDEEE